MRSLVAVAASRLPAIRAKTPVPYVRTTDTIQLPFFSTADLAAQLRTYGRNSVVYTIVNRLANSVAQVEWRLYRKARTGNPDDRVEVMSHPAIDLLNEPNKFMTRQELMETVQQHIDLCGEGWWLLGRDSRARQPMELWPAMPPRMEVVGHPTEFISHYVHWNPDGSHTRLKRDEVVQIRMPDPENLYRGLGPIQAALDDLDAAKYAALWNKNFFRNSAEPGGLIRYSHRLDDVEYQELRDRWAEQHQGVANAHRVGLLENGAEWIDRKITQRDMEFSSLRTLSVEEIRRAFGFPKPMLGDSDQVNYANARAAEIMFARWLLVPRLERIKAALNNDLLPLFGAERMVEFDFDNPVPDDPETQNAERDSKVSAAVQLITAGADPMSALQAFGLPEIDWIQGDESAVDPRGLAELVQKLYLGTPDKLVISTDEARDILNRAGAQLSGPSPPSPLTAPTMKLSAGSAGHHHGDVIDSPRAQRDDLPPELAALQEDWEEALERLLGQWRYVTAAQREDLVAQVAELVDSGQIAALASLSTDSAVAAEVLVTAMAELAGSGARRTVEEAERQEVRIEPQDADRGELSSVAVAVAALLAAGLAGAAGREALRVRAPASTGAEVAQRVRVHLEGLSDAHLRDQLGGALSKGQSEGRMATIREAPSAAYYADERIDSATCVNCLDVDGKWLGDTVEQVEQLYPGGRFRDCLGGDRCRGQVAVVYRGGSDHRRWFESERQQKDDDIKRRREEQRRRQVEEQRRGR